MCIRDRYYFLNMLYEADGKNEKTGSLLGEIVAVNGDYMEK